MKLNKTETRIMEHMAKRGRYGATVASGRNPGGGHVRNEGQREYNACLSLVKKGLAVRTSGPSFRTETHRGYGISINEIVIVPAKGVKDE